MNARSAPGAARPTDSKHRPRRLFWRRAAGVCWVAFVILLAVDVISNWWGLRWVGSERRALFRLAAGFVGYSATSPPSPGPPGPPFAFPTNLPRTTPFELNRGWLFFENHWRFQRGLDLGPGLTINLPLWIPLGLLLAAAAYCRSAAARPPSLSPYRAVAAHVGLASALASMLLLALAVTSDTNVGWRIFAVDWGAQTTGGNLRVSAAYFGQPAARRTNTPIFEVQTISSRELRHLAAGSLLPSYKSAAPQYSLDLPPWILALIVCLLARRTWRRAYVRQAGRCPKCDYDLTGNVSGRCPECGAAIELSPAAAAPYGSPGGSGAPPIA